MKEKRCLERLKAGLCENGPTIFLGRKRNQKSILKQQKKHFAEAIAAEKEQKKRIYTAVKTAEKKIHAAYLHKIKIIKTTYTIKHFLPDTLALIFSLGWIPATLYVIWWR